MRVLLLAYGSRGDVEPLVGVAAQVRAHGAEVRVCVPPDKEFAQRLAGLDVTMVPFGPPVRELMHGAAARPVTDLPNRVFEIIPAQYDMIYPAAEGCDALLATGALPIAARSVAEKLGIPYIYSSYQPVTLPSPHHPPLPHPLRVFPPGVTDNRTQWELDAVSVHTLFGDALNTHRKSIGLPPVDNVRDHIITDRPWLATDPVLGPWPEPSDLKVVQTGVWILPDHRPLSAELEAFLDAGTPPVYVGFGSMNAPQEAAEAAVEAIRAHGRRALLSRGWADLAPIDDKDDCLTIGEVNHQALFPRVAAVIHHGGPGTMATAARAGAPQVAVPQMGDQSYWASRMAALGIGAAHDGPTPTADSLSTALKTILTPETRARAAAVAGLIRTDGAAVAAKLLLES